MLVDALILFAFIATSGILLTPRLRRSATWRATVTPLASIIGSGFLILGPVLLGSFGYFAPLAMALLCLVAYLFGAAIRFNVVAETEPAPRPSRTVEAIQRISDITLGFAYFISIAYYLNLFGAFSVSLLPTLPDDAGRISTTIVFVIVLATGWLRGFRALERAEQISVSLKLAIIAGLLVGLAWFFGHHFVRSELTLVPATVTGWPALALLFGLLVTVQGFETSKYLGSEYDADTRIRTMKIAQIISTGIYVLYVLLLSYSFTVDEVVLSETAIIDMMRIVAPVLPFLLLVAALSAQFSAAIADTVASGGLLVGFWPRILQQRHVYLAVTVVGLLLTWSLNVFEIVAYASRAFALYYALQALAAALNAVRLRHSLITVAGFLGLAVIGGLIVIFGTAVEGG